MGASGLKWILKDNAWGSILYDTEHAPCYGDFKDHITIHTSLDLGIPRTASWRLPCRICTCSCDRTQRHRFWCAGKPWMNDRISLLLLFARYITHYMGGSCHLKYLWCNCVCLQIRKISQADINTEIIFSCQIWLLTNLHDKPKNQWWFGVNHD